MRMEKLTIDGVTILNDAYNSNPVSAENALNEFMKLPKTGRKIVAFGDMAELGRNSRKAHRELGKLLKGQKDLDMVIAVGDHIVHALEEIGEGISARYFEDVHEAAGFLMRLAVPGDQILLKGSRIVGLEKILEDWVRSEPIWMLERRKAGA
jgi:UDP-N-acetylmuramoyl-tripeptide--D-alanyl-D-alanine ligase